MDTLGLTKQFLPPQIKPLDDKMVVIGRALTVLQSDVAGADHFYGLMFDALDDLKPGEVYLASGMSSTYAVWGGLMSTRAIRLGAAGAVLNGYHRDTPEIRSLKFPLFSWGGFSQDQGGRGEVVDYRCPLTFQNGITVNPGDIVFGDVDGVVVIPSEYERKVVDLAVEKVRGENKVREAIEAGMSAKEAFQKFGIF